MNLFSSHSDSPENLLPKDGTVNYLGFIMNQKEADFYLQKLMDSIEWMQDELVLFGKRIQTKREVAWYGSKPFLYTYSNVSKKALSWTDELLALKQLVENATQETYNSCLLNLYHTGEEGMSWHSDDEPELKPNGTIASLSFGATRKFVFKHKSQPLKVEQILEHGSLLVMKHATQKQWLHALPKTKKVKTPRINLTFRTIDSC